VNIPRNLLLTCVLIVSAITGFGLGRALATPMDAGVTKGHTKVVAGMPLFSDTPIVESTTNSVAAKLTQSGWKVCRMECTEHLCIGILEMKGIVGLIALRVGSTKETSHYINAPVGKGQCPTESPRLKKVTK